ncbi:DUF2306 domain-containing protein [Actinokineospora enzanensis]|uniref:DUF2306 domain-containing protein n=1 Tax=Actinokineospora enzanensis TaxID=155975 RepID=UPI000374CC7D|nr:DUF2306 domain-containing protein [Actinokineospora enzanensis]
MSSVVVRTFRRTPWLVPAAALIVVFLVYSLPPYVGLDPARSRVPATSSVHYPALIAHIAFGVVAMVAGFLQLWPWFRAHYPRLHRRVGRVYVFAGVLPAAVAGFFVGMTSPFGPANQASAMLLAPLWFLSTLTGWRRVRARDFKGHREWMLRSYVLTLSTITNRIWAPILAVVLSPGLDTTFGGSEVALGQAIAGTTAWLGWTVPLIGVEWFLHRKRQSAR